MKVKEMIKQLMCYLLDHRYYQTREIDNGCSKYRYFKCHRCGHLSEYRYDRKYEQ